MKNSLLNVDACFELYSQELETYNSFFNLQNIRTMI